MLKRLLYSENERTTILIRLMLGAVFLSEGIQKFLFSETLGAGRFEKIGLPNADFLGPFVATLEIVSGVGILFGCLSRIFATVTCFIMFVAIITTKLDVLQDEGFWQMMHGSRTDWAMLLGSVFLIFKGSGKWSVDNWILNFKQWK